jgi:hypothetical protein
MVAIEFASLKAGITTDKHGRASAGDCNDAVCLSLL